LPVNDLRSMEVRIADSLIARRSPALLAGIFAGVALLLAAIGTYGVLSYMVAERRREIGIRLALGADRSTVLAQIMRQGLVLTGVGLVAGIGRLGSITSAFAGGVVLSLPGGNGLFFVLVAGVLVVASLGILIVDRHSPPTMG